MKKLDQSVFGHKDILEKWRWNGQALGTRSKATGDSNYIWG